MLAIIRNYETHIEKKCAKPKWKFCDEYPNTINHLVSTCTVLAATVYKTRQDRV